MTDDERVRLLAWAQSRGAWHDENEDALIGGDLVSYADREAEAVRANPSLRARD